MIFKKGLVIVSLLLLVSCSQVTEEKVHKDFSNRYNNSELISFHSTEGDSDNIYIEIKYYDPDKNEKEVVFLYQKNIKNGAWKFYKVL